MAVNAHGRVIALNINIYISVNGQVALILTDSLCTLTALFTVELDNQLVSLNSAVHVYVLRNTCISLACIGYVDGQGFAACINGCAFNKIHALSTFTAYVDGGCFGKFIAAVLNCAAQYIFQILVGVTGQSSIKAGGNLGFRSTRNGNMLSAAALAVSLVEEDVAYSHGYAVASQTAGNLNLAVKVSFALSIVAVGQLACQSIQCIVNGIGIQAQALIAGNQVNYGILFRMSDNGIACIEGYAVACMLIENVGVAAVIVNSQRTALFLVDVACSCCGCTAGQLSNMAAGEFFTLIYVGQSTLLLVGPGCTVLQPQICFAGKQLLVATLRSCLAAFREFVINNTGQLGIFSGQAQVYQRIFIAVNIVYCAYGYYHVTGNINLVIACADYIALFVLNGVHVDSTAGRINCAVAGIGIVVNNIDSAAVNVNGAAADVGEQAVAYTGNIYVAVNVNRAAYCTAIICVCINACRTVFGKAAVVAVQHYLHVAVDSGAACMAVYTNGMSLTGNINIYITIDGQVALILMDCMCCAACIIAVELNNNLFGLNMAVNIFDLGNTCIQFGAVGYVDGQGLAFGIHNSTLGKVHTSCILAVHIDSGIFGKFIVAVLNCAAQYIFQICLGITGQSAVEAGSNLMVGSLNIKIGYAGAFTISVAKENVTCSNSQAVAGQTAGNLNLAVQISFAVLIIGVGQLACQCIQCIVDSFGIDAQALIAGNQVNYGILFRMLDNSIACIEGYAVACMLIEDIGVAAVVINSQRVAILLINIAGSCCVRAACKAGYMAAVEQGIALPILFGRAVYFVSPACTVLQPQVNLAVALGHVGYALQRGFSGIQCQVDNRCGSITGFNCCQVALDCNIMAQTAGCFAVFQSDVHVDSTVACAQCSITALSAAVVNSNRTAAVYGNNGAVAVGMQAVAVRGDIYITVNGNRAAGFSVGAALCHNCGIGGMVIATLAAVNISLQIAVYGYIRIRCQNAIYIIVVAYGIGCGNLYITVDIDSLFGSIPVTCHNTGVFACIISAGINYQLFSGKIKLGAAVIENFDCCAVGTCGIYSQSFACCVNPEVFYGINAVNCGNSAVISKFVAAVSLNNLSFGILFISIRITGQSSSEFSSGRLGIGALAVIGKLNLAALDGYAVIGQTAGNFYGTQQVFRIICIIGVGQLACQCIQNTVELSAVLGVYFAAVGYHVDSRILGSIMNNNIAASIITCCRTVIIMFIEYSSMATVIIDINICFIILENQAGISFAAAAAELVDMGNAVISVILRCGKRRQLAQADAIGQRKGLVVPYCVILQPQVNLAGLLGAGIVHNAGPGGFVIGQADICLACAIKVRFAAAVTITHSQDITLDNNGFVSGCGCIGIDINRTAIVGNAVKRLGIILRRINIYITVSSNSSSL